MPFTFAQKVLFKHCDPAGIVFYPRYFEMMNDCVEAFFDDCLGISFAEMLKTGGTPTAEITCKFDAPSRHGDVLELVLTPNRLGRSSFGLTITGTCGAQTRFMSRSTLVYVNREGRAQPWPAAVKSRLEAFSGGKI